MKNAPMPPQKTGKELTRSSVQAINDMLLKQQEMLEHERRQRQLMAVAIGRAVSRLRLLISQHGDESLQEIDDILSPFVSPLISGKLDYEESDV